MPDLRAELLLFIDPERKLFDFNVAYVRDGGVANVGWESAGIFPSTHDAIEEGRTWLADAKSTGFTRGSRSVPWRKTAA